MSDGTKCFIICIILSLQLNYSYTVFAQDKMKAIHTVDSLFLHLYEFDFEQATKKIQKLRIVMIDKPELYVYNANYYWWLLISGMKDENYLNKCRQELLYGINLIEMYHTDKVNSSFLLLTMYTFLVRLELYEDNKIKAIFYFQHILENVTAVLKNQHVHPEYKLFSGLYLYFAQVVREDYPFISVYLLFFPKGDKKKGLQLLKEGVRSDNIAVSTESAYFLMKIFFNVEKNYREALVYSKILVDRYPENPVFLLEKQKIMSEFNNRDSIINIYKTYQDMRKNLTESQKQNFDSLYIPDIHVKKHIKNE
jgi:hypothetical protein